jgi:hypothetical protein
MPSSEKKLEGIVRIATSTSRDQEIPSTFPVVLLSDRLASPKPTTVSSITIYICFSAHVSGTNLSSIVTRSAPIGMSTTFAKSILVLFKSDSSVVTSTCSTHSSESISSSEGTKYKSLFTLLSSKSSRASSSESISSSEGAKYKSLLTLLESKFPRAFSSEESISSGFK